MVETGGEEDRSVNSIIKRTFISLTDLINKILKYDKNGDFIYNELDFSPLSKNKAFQDLGFLIAQDKKLVGLPDTKNKKLISCNFISFSFSKLDDMILSCEGDVTYKVFYVYMDYEDSNTIWDVMCKKLRENSNNSAESRTDYFRYCIKKNSNKGK